jgi:hypothetical protein
MRPAPADDVQYHCVYSVPDTYPVGGAHPTATTRVQCRHLPAISTTHLKNPVDGVTLPADSPPSIETEPDTPAAGSADASRKLAPTRSSGNSDSVEACRYDPAKVDRRRPLASDGAVRSCAMLPSAEVFRGLRHRPDETPRTIVDIGVPDRGDRLRVRVALTREAIGPEVRVVERHRRIASGCRDRRVQRLRIVKREESLVGQIAQISSADGYQRVTRRRR